MEFIFYDNGGGFLNEKNISIFIYLRYIEYVLGLDSDFLFLLVYLVVFGMVEENLKRVIFIFIVVFVFKIN